MNSSLEGSPENLFSLKNEKKILPEYSIIFIFSLSTLFFNIIFEFELRNIKLIII